MPQKNLKRLSKMDIKKEFTSQTLTPNLERMRKEGIYTDVTITCDKTTFLAHKCVLCAGSSYFLSMFKSDMIEARKCEITLQDIERDSFEAILHYLYTGDIQVFNNLQQLFSVISAAHFLQLNTLYSFYWEFALDFVSPTKFIDAWQLASLYDDDKIEQQILNTVAVHFELASETSDFLNLPRSFLVQLLRHPKLNCSTGRVFDAIKKWAKNDEDDADKLSSVYFSSHSTQDSKHSTGESNQSQLVTCFNEEGTFYIFTYNYSSRTWEPPLRIPSDIHSCTTMSSCGKALLFMGGIVCTGEGFSVTDNVVKFNIESASFSNVSHMKSPRYCFGSCNYNGSVYAAGGFSNLNPETLTKTVERYNPVTNNWLLVSDTNDTYTNPSLVALTKLYVVGRTETGDVSIEEYGDEFDSWTSIRILLPKGQCTSAAAYDNLMYISFGECAYTTFDPRTNSFEDKTFSSGFPGARKIMCLKFGENNVLLVQDDENDFYEYVKSRDEWLRLSFDVTPSGRYVGSVVMSNS